MEVTSKTRLKESFVIHDCHIDNDVLHVLWRDGARSTFDLGWLKSSVRNERRFAEDSLEYVENPLFDEVVDLTLESFEFSGNRLLIRWRDESEAFDSSWLRVQDTTLQNGQAAQPDQLLWDEAFEIPSMRYEELLDGTDWLLGLQKTGILAVHGLNAASQETAHIDLKHVAAKIGVLHRRNHPSDINVLIPAPENVGLDKAYTGGTLEYHTDAPYYEPPPKIAFLFCQQIAGGPAPINYFSDGYKLARAIEQEHPEAYSLLTSTALNFARRRPRSHQEAAGVIQSDYALDTQISAPIISLDQAGNPSTLRAHTRSVTGLAAGTSAEQIQAFAKAYRLYYDMMGQERFVRQAVIEPGTLILFDNHRLLHARSAIDSATRRVGNLCYIDPYIWDSRLRLIYAKKAGLPERWLKGCTTQALRQLANRWAQNTNVL